MIPRNVDAVVNPSRGPRSRNGRWTKAAKPDRQLRVFWLAKPACSLYLAPRRSPEIAGIAGIVYSKPTEL